MYVLSAVIVCKHCICLLSLCFVVLIQCCSNVVEYLRRERQIQTIIACKSAFEHRSAESIA